MDAAHGLIKNTAERELAVPIPTPKPVICE